MSTGLKAGIELFLKDTFSPGLSKVAAAGKQFGAGFLNTAATVDKALSGITGTLATIGVSMGAAATINKTIDFEDKIARIGTVAKMSSDEMKQFKKEIFEAAMMPDIKMNPDELVAAVDVIKDKTGDLAFAQANVQNMGRAMRAFGVDGSDMGGMMAEFNKLGYKAEEVTDLLDVMYSQGNKGAFTAAEFAKNGSAIISAYSKIGTSSKDLKNANAAMQILTMGVKDPTAAVTVLESLMQELADPQKQEKLSQLGKSLGMNLDVRDATGQFRDLTELMPEIVKAGNKLESLGLSKDVFGTIFGGVAVRGLTAFDNFGYKLEGLLDTSDAVGAVSEAAAANASTLKSNITNLQTAFTAVANAGLDGPLRALTSVLNEMAKHPAVLKAVFNALIAGIGGVMAMKGIGKVINLVNSFKGLKSGKIALDPIGGGGSASGTPVFVTNMGQGGMGASGNTADPALSGGKPAGSRLSFKQGAALAGVAAVQTALTAIPAMLGELNDINNNPELKGKEKSKAKGGAVGAAVGSIGGAAAGALAGAAIGSVVPVIGTAIGGLVGGAIGWFGGKLGRTVGEKIGEAVGKDEVIPESAAVREELETVQQLPETPVTAELTGNAVMDLNINLSGERPTVSAKVQRNSTPFQYNTGRIQEAREAF